MFPFRRFDRCVRLLRASLLIATSVAAFAPTARAVLLLGTGDPVANTTAPGGDLAESGWQYQGRFGDFLGTAIAPHFFITAKHIGRAGEVFTFRGINYAVLDCIDDRWSDLTIWRVAGTLPAFAPLYPREDEAGQRLVVIGRGTERGPDVWKDGALRGWSWGAQTRVERWGENVVSRIAYGGIEKYFLYAAFDLTGGPNEAQLSGGDSGGAVFLNDGGVWKLAGINYAVEGPFYAAQTSTSRLDAALVDVAGFYSSRDGGQSFYAYPTATPRPSGFYASRIANRRQWILSVADARGDGDGDGVPNLLEYAFDLDPERTDAEGLPRVALADGVATVTYRHVATAEDVRYTLEKSSDLVVWEPAAEAEHSIPWDSYFATFRMSVPAGRTTPLYLRVAVTQQ